MEDNVKTGKSITDEFFKQIQKLNDVDINVCQVLEDLYNNNKFSESNIKNELQKLRKRTNDENQ